MQDNLVSVITPMYNAARFVGQTIESVIAQTYPHWEMLIVDDGSRDESAAIAQEYAAKDSRIRLIRQANAGSAAARNNAIRQANGRYICLLDADDLWDACFLDAQLKLMAEKNATVVCASHKMIDQNNKTLRVHKVKPIISIKNMQITNHIPCLTGVYDTKAFGKIYLQEHLKSVRDDYAFWLEIVMKAGKAYGNQKVIASYRVLTNSTTGNKRKLIKPQFRFYYDYQKLGLIRSLLYTFYWGIAGLRKFGIK